MYQRVDVLLLGAIAGIRQAGEYAAAYRILDGLLLFPGAVVASFLPSWSARRAGFRSRNAELVVLLLLCIGVLVGIEVALASGFLIDRLYGSEYAAAGSILAILSLSAPIFYANIALIWAAYVRKREKRVALLGVIAFVTNLALNVVLISRFGGEGAAVATVVTEIVIGAGYLLTLGVQRRENRSLVVRPLATAAAYTAAVVATTLLGVATHAPWIISSLLAGTAGLVLLFAVYQREVGRTLR
jgi:O-antigen/teichoic acid export membrane protein